MQDVQSGYLSWSVLERNYYLHHFRQPSDFRGRAVCVSPAGKYILTQKVQGEGWGGGTGSLALGILICRLKRNIQPAVFPEEGAITPQVSHPNLCHHSKNNLSVNIVSGQHCACKEEGGNVEDQHRAGEQDAECREYTYTYRESNLAFTAIKSKLEQVAWPHLDGKKFETKHKVHTFSLSLYQLCWEL